MGIFNKALKLSQELKNKNPLLASLGNIARVYLTKGEADKALNYNLQVLKISKEVQNKSGIGKI